MALELRTSLSPMEPEPEARDREWRELAWRVKDPKAAREFCLLLWLLWLFLWWRAGAALAVKAKQRHVKTMDLISSMIFLREKLAFEVNEVFLGIF